MISPAWRPRLAASAAIIEEEAVRFGDDWWIIGSAAAALSGAALAEINDVDLLLSERDARALIDRWRARVRSAVGPSGQFRSKVFAHFAELPLPVDVMGGFEMRVGGAWRNVVPLTRERRGGVYTPSIAEQIELLEAMGREKDRQRIAALRAI